MRCKSSRKLAKSCELVNPFGSWPRLIRWAAGSIVIALCASSPVDDAFGQDGAAAGRGTNFVVIFADDLGYGDVQCFGSAIDTPQLQRMAREGMRLTDFHVAAAVCSASRAALLTGCYPQRVSIMGALGPNSRTGIHADEVLIPELLREAGYATACYGKWHLGDAHQFLPLQNGFDDYFGLPYSNDMWPHHPTSTSYPPLPLIDGNRTVALNPDQHYLTRWYTQHAVRFIEEHQEQPFFLYLAHNMPHVPLFVSQEFRGASGQGLYGDVIQEIDWSVGRVLDTLRRTGLDTRTLVVFTSDNGPWLSYGNHAGSAGPLREGKGTTWEGGMREPCLAWWPGHIPAGSECRELATTMDLLPTFARLAGAKPPPDRKIDGHDIWPLLAARPGAQTPYAAFFHYWAWGLEGVRSGRWKLHFPHPYRSLAGPPGRDGRPGPYQQRHTELALYDLQSDVGEQRNVAAEHPDVVARLSALGETMRQDLGDSLSKRKGQGVRPPGRSAG